MTAAEPAAKTLAWLQVVGAVRRVEESEPGAFVVELPDRKLLALSAEAVAVFRAGVLCGWRLPRGEAPA